MPLPLVVAHRGDNANYPENTLLAFASAIRKGADALEMDVYLTRDGELVIHHDMTLGRTVPGEGFIGDYTLPELKRLEAGAWFSSAFAGERIPTLGEVLELGRGRVRFELELRTPSEPFLTRLFAELAQYGVEGDTELTSPHLPLLAKARAMQPELRTGIFVAPYPPWVPAPVGQRQVCDYLTLLDAQVAHVPIGMLTLPFVEKLHAGGWLVHAANLTTEAECVTARALGVDQVSTDDLELVIRVLKT
jgi:glycerophosphoryl diester phosphodiesterase